MWAYGPYVREIDIWADLFPELMIAAPLRKQRPPTDCQAFRGRNIKVKPRGEWGGVGTVAKLWAAARLPLTAVELWRALQYVDAIHVRCPGNLGLVGAFIAPIVSNRIVAKYAGQWSDYPAERSTFRLQKWVLRSRWWRGPVTVDGPAGGTRKHVIPFFTSVMDSSHRDRAQKASARRSTCDPLHMVFVGRLSTAKNVDVLLDAVATARSKGIGVKCTIVGDGPEKTRLERHAATLGISDVTFFAGGLSFDSVMAAYEEADVAVLASQTEGWPKEIAEAMAFGLVCIGSDCGLVSWMLGKGRGVLVPPRDAMRLADAIGGVAHAPAEHLQMGRRATLWARRYSIEGLRSALAELLAEQWGVKFPDRADSLSP
jgi:glycosyltransferase involved in cell wall biosynthesis